MTQDRSQRPSELWSLVTERSRRALSTGLLQPLPTEVEILHDRGVDFIVRKLVAPRAGVELSAVRSQERRNPFLPPYEEGLLIGDISPTHVCLLNKYCVLDGHILLVTRDFEDQEELLTREDFAAGQSCLEGMNGLVFYNSGAGSGASQQHKHLQVVPLPLAEGTSSVPVAALLESSLETGSSTCAALPFAHGLQRISPPEVGDSDAVPASLFEAYRRLLREMVAQPHGRTGPHNLLFTREWMLLVPRSSAAVDTLGVNALGFAGSLMARSDEERALIDRMGPMNVLECVARSPGSCSG